jgi:hypothetical protein
LREIRSVKPRGQTLTAYVREALERDLRRFRLQRAAEEFQRFLDSNSEERAEHKDWSEAPLAQAPRSKHRKRLPRGLS